MSAVKTDKELVKELRQFHHYEAAKRLEALSCKGAIFRANPNEIWTFDGEQWVKEP